MKIIIKYIATLVTSSLLFVAGDAAVKGAWVNKLGNTNLVINHKLGVEESQNKNLFVSIASDKNIGINKNLLEGLQIQLMNDEYTVVQIAVVKNGIAVFDLSKVKSSYRNLILISPITSNEMAVTSEMKYVTMKLDMSEINIIQKSNKVK
ncbi:MAG: hypothetical protein JHD28_01010 [Bacteroidia bacterium]|nr:hypothetical protein [Bacteroidia bacterium]